MNNVVDIGPRLRVVAKEDGKFQPCMAVVEKLEKLLELAKAGQLHGIAYSICRTQKDEEWGEYYRTWAFGSVFDGTPSAKATVAAGLVYLLHAQGEQALRESHKCDPDRV